MRSHVLENLLLRGLSAASHSTKLSPEVQNVSKIHDLVDSLGAVNLVFVRQGRSVPVQRPSTSSARPHPLRT